MLSSNFLGWRLSNSIINLRSLRLGGANSLRFENTCLGPSGHRVNILNSYRSRHRSAIEGIESVARETNWTGVGAGKDGWTKGENGWIDGDVGKEG